MARTGTATILFTDLVASTQLRATVGDALADDLRHVHDGILRAAIAERDGTVVKGLGDGLMATFASAAAGVSAAIAIQQAIDVHNRRAAGPPLSVRVGLSAGDVLWEEDGDCFGGPVIEASRLCGTADGGQILVSEVVRLLAGLVEGESARSRGAVQLKGRERPVLASEVVWEPATSLPPLAGQPPLPAALAGSRPLALAGRERELDGLLEAWKTSVSGTRQAVLLSGEPGIGKTRLAQELALRAHDEGATVLYGRCEEELGAPYQPFAEALEHVVETAADAELSASLGQYPGELVRLCPAVATVVADLPPPLQSDAETERYRLFTAVGSWLTAAAHDHGLVLVLDDLHWAARPTLVLLQHVLLAAPNAHLLVVGTYRDTDLDRTHPLTSLLADLRRTPGVQRVPLPGLDRDGVAELMRDAAGHELDEKGRSLASALHAETDGNPFFVGEILRHLRDSGEVFQHDSRWVSVRPVAELGIPEGVREVVGRRLDRLSDAANDVLSTAAVVGRDFELDTVTGASGVDPDVAVAALDEAIAARLVEETAVGRYMFSHALVRSTLYDELSATRRARMHARVARDLERRRPDDVAALAHHYAAATVAGDIDKAVDYSHRAGDEAMAQVAHDHAVDYYRQALELLVDRVPPDERRRCEVLIGLGEAQRRSGDGRYRQTLLDAADLARRCGTTDQLVRAALLNGRGFWSMAGEVDVERIGVLQAALDAVGERDSCERARLLARLAGELMFSSDRRQREALCEEAVEVARRVGDRIALADVLAEAAPASYTPWAIDRSQQHVEELLALAEEIGDPYRLALAHLWSVVTYFFVAGDPEVRRTSMEVATRLGEELGQPTLRWLTSAFRVMQLQTEGRPADVEREAAEAFALGERAAQPDALTWFAGQLGTVLRELGRFAEALPMVEQEYAAHPGLPAWRVVHASVLAELGRDDEAAELLRGLVTPDRVDLPEDVLWLFGVALLLETAVLVGDVERSDALYSRLLPFRRLSIHGGVSYNGSAELYLALGARAAGRLDLALEHLDAAQAVHERMGARLYLGLTHAERSRVLLLQGAPEERVQAERALAQRLAAETGSPLVTRRLEMADRARAGAGR